MCARGRAPGQGGGGRVVTCLVGHGGVGLGLRALRSGAEHRRCGQQQHPARRDGTGTARGGYARVQLLGEPFKSLAVGRPAFAGRGCGTQRSSRAALRCAGVHAARWPGHGRARAGGHKAPPTSERGGRAGASAGARVFWITLPRHGAGKQIGKRALLPPDLERVDARSARRGGTVRRGHEPTPQKIPHARCEREDQNLERGDIQIPHFLKGIAKWN